MAESKITPQLPRTLAGKARTATPFSGFARGAAAPRDDRYNVNVDPTTLRGTAKAAEQLRAWYEADGTVSTAVAQFVAMANTPLMYKVYTTGSNEFDHSGLKSVETVVSSLDTLWNYTKGFQDKKTLDLVKETLLLEVILTGGCAIELVLDTHKLPDNIAVIPYETLDWISDGNGGKYPTQKAQNGDLIELKYPNVFVSESLKQANRRYALPLMVSGLKRLIAYEEFIASMRRVLRQSGQPRLLVQLDYEKVRASAPPEVAMDSAKLETYLNGVRSNMENILSDLNPEDALVFYDLATVTSADTTGEKSDYATLTNELAGLAASALKTNPSALGLRVGTGSQNVASTEALLSAKLASSFQRPVEAVLSRALTLAVRLLGVDCYVKAEFEDIDLRPKAELEAHLSMRQQRVLELLSLGRITDDEAQSMLGLGSIPDSAEELSGTRFLESKPLDTMPASGTNSMNQTLQPEGATSGGGKDNAQRV